MHLSRYCTGNCEIEYWSYIGGHLMHTFAVNLRGSAVQRGFVNIHSSLYWSSCLSNACCSLCRARVLPFLQFPRVAHVWPGTGSKWGTVLILFTEAVELQQTGFLCAVQWIALLFSSVLPYMMYLNPNEQGNKILLPDMCLLSPVSL